MNDRKKRKTLKKKRKTGKPNPGGIAGGTSQSKPLSAWDREWGMRKGMLPPIERNPNPTPERVFKQRNPSRNPPANQPTDRPRKNLTYVKLKKLGSSGKYQIFFQDCKKPMNDANNVFKLSETYENSGIYSVESGNCVNNEFNKSN